MSGLVYCQASTIYFVYRIFILSIHKVIYGLQRIHKRFYSSIKSVNAHRLDNTFRTYHNGLMQQLSPAVDEVGG